MSENLSSSGDTKCKSRVSQIYNLKKFDHSQFTQCCNNINKQKQLLLSNIGRSELYLNFIYKHIPIFVWLPKYEIKSFLVPDLVAGITVGVMNIPQGMAYSLLASLSAVNGLYISFFPIIIYAMFGTSKHLAIGSYALISLLTSSSINKMVRSYELNLNSTGLFNSTASFEAEIDQYRMTVATSLALLVGIFQIILGISGLGILTSYFSDTFISSYTCASAIHVIKSQVKDLFGIQGTISFHGAFNLPKSFADICKKLPLQSNWQTTLISFLCIAYLVAFKAINPKIKQKLKITFPSELFLIIFFTTVSAQAKLVEYGVRIVGHVPTGLPHPDIPDITLWPQLWSDALIISLICFSVSISMACLFGRKHKYPIDSTQELYAYGLANIFSSFFQCYPSSASLSRSSVLEQAGSKTMMSSLIGSFIILTVILFLGPMFEQLPKACLAAIIVVAFQKILMQFLDMFRLWNINKLEAITWFVTFFSVVLIDVDYGLVIGVLVSVLMIIVRDQRLQPKQLAKYDCTDEFVPDDFITNITRSHSLKNVKIFKAQQSIYFVNCEKFKEELLNRYNSSLSDTQSDLAMTNPMFELPEINAGSSQDIVNLESEKPNLILDFSAVNYIDTNGVKMVEQIIEDFSKINVTVYICEGQEWFIRMLYRMKLLEKFDENIYVTINEALGAISKKANQNVLEIC